MPPWKPEPGYGNFDHVRRLTDEQIARIQEWAAAGRPGRRCGRQAGCPDVSDRLAGRRTRPGAEDVSAVLAAGGWSGPVPLLRAADESDQGIVRQRRRVSPGQSARGASCADFSRFERHGSQAGGCLRRRRLSVLRRAGIQRRGIAGGLGSGIHSPARGTGAIASGAAGHRRGDPDSLSSFGQSRSRISPRSD